MNRALRPLVHGCESCPMHTGPAAFGIKTAGFDYVVALAGNPNTGKSTLFNALTGLRQHTGNWPGKTVTRAEGSFVHGGRRYKLVDLPGTYSLLAASPEEQIARDFLVFGRPDVTVVVTDATQLERNLHLVLQVLEVSDRTVVAVNLVDEAERRGLLIDVRRLAAELGVPVVPTAARHGRGVPQLLRAIEDVATGRFQAERRARVEPPATLAPALERLTTMVLQAFPGLPNARWVAMRLLEGDQTITDAVRFGVLGELATAAASPATVGAARAETLTTA